MDLLVGRDAELKRLDRAVTDVRGGTPRALALIGDAGIGKTALMRALTERADGAGLLVLSGIGAEHERDIPFALAVDALDDHVSTMRSTELDAIGPDLAAVLPSAATSGVAVAAPASERFRYHQALRQLLEVLAAEQPVALILDDVYWADEASLEFLSHLLRRPTDGPVLVAFASRPRPLTERLLADGEGIAGFEHLAIGPLDDKAVAKMLAGEKDAETRTRVTKEAAGNPLYVEELARAARIGDGALPADLMTGVELELDALPPAAVTLIHSAAVVGEPFALDVAAEVAQLDAGDLEAPLKRLLGAGLIRPDGDAYAFRHPLVRRAVYESVPPGWRLAAHERAAQVLAARGAGTMAQAHHVAQSARPGDEDAIALLLDAAAQSSPTAPSAAARWYAAVERLLPERDTLRRATALWPMAFALVGAGRLPEAHVALSEALTLLPDDPTPERLSLVATCAGMEHALGLHEAATHRLLGALETAPQEGRAGLCAEMTVAAFYAEDRAAMLEWGDRAIAAAGDTDHAIATTAHALKALALLWTQEPEQAEAELVLAEERFARMSDRAIGGRLEPVLFLGMALLLFERVEEADAVAARGLAAAGASHQGHLLTLVGLLRLWTAFHRMDFETALREADAGEERARLQGGGFPLAWALGAVAFARDGAGQRTQADAAAAEARQIAADIAESHLSRVVRCNVAILHSEVDPAAGSAEILEVCGSDVERVDPTWQPWVMLALTRASIATGDLERAAEWADRCSARAEELSLPAGAVRGHIAQAEVRLARGDAAGAREFAHDAALWAVDVRATRDEVEALLVRGRAEAALKDTDTAVATLEEVAARAGAGQAFKLRDAAARELRRLGARVAGGGRRSGAGAAGGLTDREQEIAELVVSGHTNKQVAAALFLSEKTVEHHLSNIYAKLGVRSRTALPAALRG